MVSPRVGSLIVVIVALGPPIFFGVVDPFSFSAREAKHIFSMVVKWTRVGLIAGIILVGEGRPLYSIGLQGPRWSDLLFGIGTLVGLLVLNSALQSAVTAAGLTIQAGEVLQTLSEMPIVLNAAIALTAGVTEEVLYRGAAIERLEELTGTTSIAALLPAVVFVGAHLPAWGLGSGIVQFGYVVVFTLVYLYTRRLAPVIIAHVLLDSIGLLLVPAIQ